MEQQVLKLSERTAGPRYVQLDALRGLAAFTVVLHHLGIAYGVPYRWYLQPFVAGHQAVILFFVLSGFVLSLSFWNKGTSGPYKRYLIRRFFRIYVPFAVAVGVSAIGAAYFMGSRLPLGAWFSMTWQTPVTAGLLARQLLMWPGAELNTAFWSLRYEVQMSIVFPFVLMVLGRVKPWVALLGSAVLIGVGGKLHDGLAHDPHFYVETMEYGGMFLWGAMLAERRHWAGVVWSRMPRSLRVMAVLGSAFLYFGYAFTLEDHFGQAHSPDLLSAIGACGLVLCSLYSGMLRRALAHTVPEYLGRISYSLYLVHGTVLFAALNLLYWRVSRPVLGLIFVVATFGLSHLFCIWIEEPSLRLGGRLSMKMRERVI